MGIKSIEWTVENIEQKFDETFRDIDVMTNDMFERNTVSIRQILESYQEDRNNR